MKHKYYITVFSPTHFWQENSESRSARLQNRPRCSPASESEFLCRQKAEDLNPKTWVIMQFEERFPAIPTLGVNPIWSRVHFGWIVENHFPAPASWWDSWSWTWKCTIIEGLIVIVSIILLMQVKTTHFRSMMLNSRFPDSRFRLKWLTILAFGSWLILN